MEGNGYQRTTLNNGLRIVTEQMPGTRSVAVSIYVGAGSRYETPEEAGISHLLEHLLFKGTSKRPTAQEISELIEGVGGVMNAGTDRELTVYYAKVARPHFDRAADVLTDMVRNPLIAPEEIEKERKVVIEELSSIGDSPAQLVDVLLDATMWPDQPLGRDVAGTEASVTALTRAATLDYLHRQYVPNNIVVAVAGAIEHEEVVAAIDARARRLGPRRAVALVPRDQRPAVRTHRAPVQADRAGPHRDRDARDVEPGPRPLRPRPRQRHPRRRHEQPPLPRAAREARALLRRPQLRQPLSRHRLVRGLRRRRPEEGGRVGEGAARRAGEDAGAAASPTTSCTRRRSCRRDGCCCAWRTRAASPAGSAARRCCNGGIKTPDEVVALVEAVTPDDMRRIAKQVLDQNQMTMAIVGPFRSDKKFSSLLGVPHTPAAAPTRTKVAAS